MNNQNHTSLVPKGITKLLFIAIILVHLLFFLLEAVFWMIPEVHHPLIELLDNPVSLEVHLQALILKNLFINQGFYNLFLVCAGVWGLQLLKKGNSSGYVLFLFLCLAATGAGLVLALSTRAYLLAIFQALPATIAFIRLYPFYQNQHVTIKNQS